MANEHRNSLNKTLPSSELLELAFETAWYLHGDWQIAVQLLVHAVEAMNLRAERQAERVRKQQKTKPARQVPNKVLLSQAQRYQLGVWEVSTYYELFDEARQFPGAARRKLYQPESSMVEKMVALQLSLQSNSALCPNTITEKTLLIRYIKHLALLAVEQNALYTAIGINRLLYAYSPDETTKIYGKVDGKYERGLDSKIYGEARRSLWQGLHHRFIGLIQTQVSAQKESVFASKAASPELLATILECLNHLTLWETSCAPIDDEAARIHKLFHPPCHNELLVSLKLALPSDRLRIPIFTDISKVNNDHQNNKPGSTVPKLSPEQAELLGNVFEKLRKGRKNASSNWLLVVADGVELAAINLLAEASTSIELPENTRLIEIYSREIGGDLMLATCWLTEFDESGERVIAEARAEGGQVVRFDIGFAEGSEAAVTISYRETKAIRWLALEWRWLVHRFRELSFAPKPLTAWAMAGAAALALLFTLWLWQQNPNELPKVVKQASPTVEPSPVALPSPTVELPLIAENRPKPQSGKRSGSTRNSRISLSLVTRVFVQSLGEDEFSRNLREALIAKLRQSPLAVEDQILYTTDAVLQTKPRANKRQVTLRLVNRAGKVLWKESFKRTDVVWRIFKKQHDAKRIAEQAVNKLVEAIEAEKRKAQ